MSKYILQVKQVNTNLTNCFMPLCTENAFATVCEYMGLEYQYAFAYATNFSFSREFCDSGRVADGIFTEYNFIKYFEDIYHTGIEQKHFSFFSSYIKYITDMLAGNIPIIAHFDSYYIPWSTLYHIRHTFHLVIVIGIDTDTKSLTILDPIDLDEPATITYKEFKKASQFCLEIEAPKDIHHICTEQFISDILASPDSLIHSDVFNNLHTFAASIQDMFNPYVEFRDCHNHSLMLEEKLVDDIRKLMQSINIFTFWLQWFDTQTKEFSLDTVIEEFKSILSKWNILINMLYKRSLTSWEADCKDKISEFIDNITAMHEAAYVSLLDCLKNHGIKNATSCDNQVFNRSIPVDLRDFFNNKGFAVNDGNSADCDLTGAGEYYKIDCSHTDTTFCIDNIDFRIEHGYEQDNIICNNQVIHIDVASKSVGIGLICCSEWGRANDMITVNFADGTSKRFAVYANDLPEYNTKTSCITGQTFDKENNIIQERAALTINVFYYTESQVTSIVLPKCPSLHILAMSMLV